MAQRDKSDATQINGRTNHTGKESSDSIDAGYVDRYTKETSLSLSSTSSVCTVAIQVNLE